MERVWVALGPDDARERVAADTGAGPAAGDPGAAQRPAADARTTRRRDGSASTSRARRRGGQTSGREAYRVRIEAGPASSARSGRCASAVDGEPDRTETRLLSAAADQIGQALAQDRLAAEAQAAEIARQSDALKSALLQSVSHDLRTPLATIRAAAGTLRPGSGLSADDQQESADAIDREVEYLNRLVTNLLDLSRIEAGALRAERDVYELDDLVGQTVERLRPRLGDRPLEVDLAAPPVAGRPGLPRRGGDERARERHQVHAARDGRSGSPRRRSRRAAGPAHGRGRRTGRAGRGAAQGVRQVLPGPGRCRWIPVRDRHRSRGRPRAGRGDGRPGRGAPERARRAGDRHRPAEPRPVPAAPAVEAPRDGRPADPGRADRPGRRGRRRRRARRSLAS